MILRVVGEPGLLRVNSSFVETLGLTSADLEGRPFLDWIHPGDRAELKFLLQSKDGSARARLRTKGGEWMSFEWQVRLHPHGHSVLGTSQGAKARIVNEPTRPVSPTGSMAETLDKMARIVEARNPSLLCSILLVDLNEGLVTVGVAPSLPAGFNEQVEGIHIGPVMGSCGTAAYWNVPVVVEDIHKDPLWKDQLEIAGSAGVRACWSVPVVSTEGSVLGAMALYSREPVRPTQDQIHGLRIAAQMVGVAIERHDLEAHLSEAGKLDALGVLAGGIAHDFNNLLAVILANAELAAESTRDNFAVQRMLGDIISASRTAADLCNQMLAYAGRGAVAVEATECNVLIKELGSLLHAALSKKATLQFNLANEPLGVVVDRVQLRQVLLNLVTNASDALEGNEGTIAISTDTRILQAGDPELRRQDGALEPGEYVRIQVSDNGVGMTAATQAKIFDPFFSTKTSSRGLGLAAVQGIVLKNGGFITFESREQQGTTFSLLFPRAPLAEVNSQELWQTPVTATGGCVLVVDDEPMVQLAMANILQHAGYSVLCANDGQEAVDVFREHADRIDCIVLDYSMPKLNGIEAFAEIRRIRPGTPVLLSSGYTEHEMMVRFRGEGLAGAIHKPAPVQVIIDKVARALESRKRH